MFGKVVWIVVFECDGYLCYMMLVGWFGYSDDKLCWLCCEVVEEGFDYVKLKVGGNFEDDICCVMIVCEVIGFDCKLMIDVN